MTTSIGAGVGAVDLVDDDDRLAGRTRSALRQHEAGLRHRALGGVDQHQRAVDHVQDALDLAAEIGVARGVDDVDLGVLARAPTAFLARMVMPRSRSRSLESIDALDQALVVAVDAALPQQAVDQGGLAVVDVGDDGDVAKVHSSSSEFGQWLEPISPENRDPLFRITLKTWNSKGAWRPKRKPGQKDRAHLARCAAI